MSDTILLVEDNPDDAELTMLGLKRGGLVNEVIRAHDGVEAVELLHGTADQEPIPLPAFVLLDMNMPRMNGIETLRAIRSHERTAALPVIMLTSNDDERLLLETYKLHVNSYVVKPVDFDCFVTAAAQVGMYWLMVNKHL